MRVSVLVDRLTFSAVCLSAVGLYDVVRKGDSGILLRWRGSEAPSVTGPFMVGVKDHVPLVGTPLFKLWLDCRRFPGQDVRGVDVAARTATPKDKALYEDHIDQCLVFMTYTGTEDKLRYMRTELQCRAMIAALVRSNNPVMVDWVLDMWEQRYVRHPGTMDTLLKAVHATGM